MQLKNINRIQVLNYIRRHRLTTKANLAQESGLTFMAIQKIMEELMRLGLVRQSDVRSGQIGRKSATYTIDENYGYTAGLHINMFKTTAAVMNLHGEIISEREIDMGGIAPMATAHVDAFVGAVEGVIKDSGVDRGRLLGLGIGAPGPVNPVEGMILSPPNMPQLRYLPIQRIMRERLELPVQLSKDTNAIALCEYWRGAGAGHDHMVYIDADMGIGSGLILMGQLQQGHNYAAGEFGHITIDEDGPVCNCGNRGCLEAMASGIAILREAKRQILESPGHPLQACAPALGLEGVLEAAGGGDITCISILNQAACHMGSAIGSLINILDPERIVVGGLLAIGYEPYLNIVRDTAMSRSLPRAQRDRIARIQCGSRAGVIGAGDLVAEHFFSSLVGGVLEKN